MSDSIRCVVGMDVGDRWAVVGGVDLTTGEEFPHRRIECTPEAMCEFFEGLPQGTRVVLETGGHSPWISRISQAFGHETYVAQARKLRAIWQSPNKSDDRDTDILWQIGHARPELLSPIEHRSARAQRHLSVVRLRDQAVGARKKLVCAVRGSVKSMGHRIVGASPETFPRHAAEQVPDELAPAVLPMLDAVEALTQTIRAYDREVKRLCEEEYAGETRRLLEVTGVGPLTALTFVLVIDDPGRFRKSRDVGPYVGLVPRRDQSGDSDKQLPITKAGDKLLRKLLVQCAHYIIGPFGTECDLRRWALARLDAGGASRRKRTLVAVARRLAVMLHRLWVDDVEYDPLFRMKRTSAVAA